MTQLNRSNLGVILRFCSSLTVHLMLRGDFHPFSCPELKEEVGSFFSCEMAKINFINLKKRRRTGMNLDSGLFLSYLKYFFLKNGQVSNNNVNVQLGA